MSHPLFFSPQAGRPLVASLAALVLAACGGPSDARQVVRCAGTLTGALERTFGVCNGFEQLYRQNLDTLLLSASYDELTRLAESRGAAYTVTARVELDGEPRDGRTAKPTCTLTVKAGAQTWLANAGSGAPLGTCAVEFSEVVPHPQTGNIVTYCILRGSLSGRLEPDPSIITPEPPGRIDLKLDFDASPASADPERQRALCPAPG